MTAISTRRSSVTLGLLAVLSISGARQADAFCTLTEQWSLRLPYPSTPVVAQLTDDDGDGDIDALDTPDVVVVEIGEILVIDGATGAIHFAITGFGFASDGLSVGDIDGDGLVEIIVPGPAFDQVLAFEHDGTHKWTSDPCAFRTSPLFTGIADLDRDGRPEVFMGTSVFDRDGKLLWQDARTEWRVHAVDLDATSPGLEILSGIRLLAADGRLLWESAAIQPADRDGAFATGVGDVDGDGDPEIAVTTKHSVYILDHLGAGLGPPFAMTADAGSSSAIPPVLADLDGDGDAEVVATDSQSVYALDWNGAALRTRWQQPAVDLSGASGAIAADLNGDGAVEIIRRGEPAWYIFDGRTGASLASESPTSTTAFDLPVVADIDYDCKTEILIRGNGPLVAYECDTAPLTRPVWNQSDYHVTNVADDGSIPAVEQPPWSAGPGWLAQQVIPDVPPPSVGNTLLQVRAGGNVEMVWIAPFGARSYAVYRSDDKTRWPPSPHLTDLGAARATLADVAPPPELYFYRVTPISCSGREGP